MTVAAIFAVALAVGTYWGVTYSERSRQVDAHIRRFLDQLDRENR